jgi:hypothetical protein
MKAMSLVSATTLMAPPLYPEFAVANYSSNR